MNKKTNILLSVLLFSVLGIFSHMLLVGNERINVDVRWWWALLFFIFAFNVIGFTILRLNTWLSSQYSRYLNGRVRTAVIFALIAAIMLVLNYGLLVAAKVLSGSAHPLTFQNGGQRILTVVWLVELIIISLLLINRTVLTSLRLQKEASALQQQNNIARYVALQNQLNPHFLFNSLNTLIAEIEYEPKNAVHFTRNLSDVYRYVLQSQNQMLASLGEELTFMDSYIFLHQVRLGHCIELVSHVGEGSAEAKLPPLTLQLLVENVIKHNSINPAKPMKIEIRTEDDMLVVSNRINPKINKTTSGTGLRNLADRYMLLTNQKIEILNANGLFTVKVPLIYE